MLRFRLSPYDQDFDFVHGRLPDSLLFAFGDQFERARAILASRDNAQILYALGSLDWLLQKGSELLFDGFVRDSANRGQFINRAKAFQKLMGEADLDDQPSFPEATWGEYFAVLALAGIAEELFQAKQGETSLSDSYSELSAESTDRLRSRYETALEAMEAVCFAESLQREEQLMRRCNAAQASAETELARQRGTKGGRVRASRFNALRQKVVDAYDNGYQNRSNRQAARRIWRDEISDTDRSVLSGEEPWLTLERWIAAHKSESS